MTTLALIILGLIVAAGVVLGLAALVFSSMENDQ